MARWCVLLLLLAASGTLAEETTTEGAASTEAKTEHPTRMTPLVNITTPPLIHEANSTAAPNVTEKTPGKGAAAPAGGQLAVAAVLGAWLILSAI